MWSRVENVSCAGEENAYSLVLGFNVLWMSARYSLSCLILCMSWLYCQSFCEIMCTSSLLCLKKCCFLKFIHHPWILQDLCPFFHIDMWTLRGEEWHRYNHLGMTIPKSLILCMFIICRLLYWLQSFMRNFSNEGWVVYLPIGIANFFGRRFSRILVVGFSLRPMAI